MKHPNVDNKIKYITALFIICGTVFFLYPGCNTDSDRENVEYDQDNACGLYSQRQVEQEFELYQSRNQGSDSSALASMRIQDIGQVSVVEDNGTMTGNPAGVVHILRKFYSTHNDWYDFITIYANFPIPGMDRFAWHIDVSQQVNGIGKPIMNMASIVGSKGRLKGIQLMNSISKYPSDPEAPALLGRDAYELLAHHTSHQWSAFLKFRQFGGPVLDDLSYPGLRGHFINCMEANKDFLNGHTFRDNGDGTYTDLGACDTFGLLTLYSMGMIAKSEVPPFLLINRTDGGCTMCCFNIGTITGTPRTITIDDIISAEGPRIPDYSKSQKYYNMAFILVTSSGDFPASPLEIQWVSKVRQGFPGHFKIWTNGRGTMDTSIDTIPRPL